MKTNTSPIENTTQAVITSLFRAAKGDKLRMMKGFAKAAFKPLSPSDMDTVHMSLSQKQGAFIYETILENN